MKPSEAVKPISYLKAHASEMLRDVAETQGAVIITQNGEAKAVLQDVRVYEQFQDSLALLKILAQSRRSVRTGRVSPLNDALRRIRARVRGNARG